MFCFCNLYSLCFCTPAGVWTVTTVTRSWAQEATVDPACAPTGRAVDATFPTAVTHWLTSWCVCAALATKVHTTTLHQKLPPCTGLFHSGVTLHVSLTAPLNLAVLAACRRQV